MAELTHWYYENNDLLSTTATAIGTAGVVASEAGLTSGTKYLVVVRALVGSSSATDKIHIRMLDGIGALAGKGAYGDSFDYEMEATGTTNMKSFMYVSSFTSAGGTLACKLYVDGSTGYADQRTMWVLDLDAIGTEGTDYHEFLDRHRLR